MKPWLLESLGIEEVSSDPACIHFASTLQVTGGRYKVSLPWRNHHDNLPNNFGLNRRRLHSLLRQLQQNPEIL